MTDTHDTPRDESDIGEDPIIFAGEDPDESDMEQPPIIFPGGDPDESDSDDSEPAPSDPETDS